MLLEQAGHKIIVAYYPPEELEVFEVKMAFLIEELCELAYELFELRPTDLRAFT